MAESERSGHEGCAQQLKYPVRRAFCGGAFSWLRILSPGHRHMGFSRYREALLIGIEVEGGQDVVTYPQPETDAHLDLIT